MGENFDDWLINREDSITFKEKQAIERCKELIKPEHANWIGLSNQKAIKTLLNLIEKEK